MRFVQLSLHFNQLVEKYFDDSPGVNFKLCAIIQAKVTILSLMLGQVPDDLVILTLLLKCKATNHFDK